MLLMFNFGFIFTQGFIINKSICILNIFININIIIMSMFTVELVSFFSEEQIFCKDVFYIKSMY